MASKYQFVDNQFYYRGSDVPQNRFDIKESATIQWFEQINDKRLFDVGIKIHG